MASSDYIVHLKKNQKSIKVIFNKLSIKWLKMFLPQTQIWGANAKTVFLILFAPIVHQINDDFLASMMQLKLNC